MSERFGATLRQHYRLTDTDLLVLDEYEGDVGTGDVLAVELPGGRKASFSVHDLAWGSAYNAASPPLTLIVKGLGAIEPEKGARITPVS